MSERGSIIPSGTVIPLQEHLIWKKDWDYLLVLDACRYDMFEELNDIEGDLIRVWSPAPHTQPWMRVVFGSSKTVRWDDTVVVSASQFSNNYASQFKAHRNCVLKDWDDEADTISAKNINRAVLAELRGYPDDKMIIWYVQPHVPFIGKTRIGHKEMKLNKTDLLTLELIAHDDRYGLDGAKQAYYENLEYVLEYVKELLPHLHGKIIITSDHGNYLGEGGFFGHERRRANTVPVRLVPWLEVDLDESNK